MKTKIHLILALAAIGLNAFAGGSASYPAGAVIPLITLDNVPLKDAVFNLARQIPTNIIFDPGVWVSFGGANGGMSVSSKPNVNARWTNVTAQAALDDLLKVYKLAMVTNPVTSVGRIVEEGKNIKSVAASELGGDTGKTMPLIKMEGVALHDAIENLARQAGLAYVFDPAVNLSNVGPGGSGHYEVAIRWENITIKQALAALLDNYGLTMVQNPGEPAARITMKKDSKGDGPK